MFLSSGQYKALIITFEKLVLVSTIVVCKKKEEESQTKTLKKNRLKVILLEPQRFITPVINYTNQLPQPMASPSLCIVLVCLVCGCYLSSTIKTEGFFFCSAQMFSRSCCSLRRKQPLRGQRIRTVVDFVR